MKLRLVAKPGKVLRHAWSSHLLILAGLLTAAEAALPYVYGSSLIPLPAFPFVMFGIVLAAFIARYILQESLHDD